MLKIAEIVMWGLVGIIVMLQGRQPSKLEYFFVWLCLMINIVIRFMGEKYGR